MSTEINISANNNDTPSIVEVFVDKDAAAAIEEAVIRAEQVLNQTINLISGIDNRNTILFDAGFTKIGQQFTALANTRWNIGGAEYFNAEPMSLHIELSSVGKQRWVRVCLNRDNNFFLLQGEELVENPPLPVLLDNTLSYTFFLVTDTNVGNATPPVTGEIYRPKNESNFIKATGTHAADFIDQFWLNTEASHIVLESIAEIKSLVLREGFKAYPGKQIIITNNGVSDLKIKHGHLSNVKFVFANNTDYIAKPKETVVFYLSEDLTTAHFLSSSIGSKIKRIYTMSNLFTITNSSIIGYKSIAAGGSTVSFATETNTTNPEELISKPILRWFGAAPFNCKLTKVVISTNTSTQNNHLAIIKGNNFISTTAVKQLVYDLSTGGNQSAEATNPLTLTTLNKGDYIGLFVMTQLTSGTTVGWYHLEFEEID